MILGLESITGGILGGILSGYFLTQYKDYRERQKKHQEELIKSLKEWLNRKNEGGRTGDYPIRCPEPAPGDFDTYVCQHLQEVNPRVLELLDELKDMYSTCKVRRQNLIKDVGELVSQKYEELKDKLHDMKHYDIRNFKNKVIQEVSYEVEYEQIVIQPTIKTEKEHYVLILEGANVARSNDLSAINELREFFYKLVQNERITHSVKEIIQIRKEYNKNHEELREIVENIITYGEHGNRLRGRCDYCPKFELF